MKLGLFALVTGIAAAIGLSRMKRADAPPAAAGKRPKAPAPQPQAPVTGAAPQEGINMKAAPASPAKSDGGARVTAP